MAPDLVTVGGLTVDNVIAADGTVALARVGGNGAYSGVGALCWTERVGLVSIAVATYPRAALQRLAEHGLDLGGVRHAADRLEHADWFIYDEDGHRHERLRSHPDDLARAGYPTDRLTREQLTSFESLLKERGPPAEMTFSQFRDAHPLTAAQVPEPFKGARGVHIAPSRPVVVEAMLSVFGRPGRVVTLDSGWQLAELTIDALRPYLAAVDAFLPSEVELRALCPGAELADALAVFAPLCRGTVAVKIGPRGSLVWDKAAGAPVHVPARTVPTVDPTGAGDSYCGGFLAGLVETGDPVTAAAYGTVSASLIVGRFGADGALPIDRAACREALADHLAVSSLPPPRT